MKQNRFINSILNEVYGYYTKDLLNEGMDELSAKHASGASFDKFDHSFIGTGLGSQVYGWGTYVSTDPEVHKGYMNKFKHRPTWIPGTINVRDGGVEYDVEIPDDNGFNYIDWNGSVPDKVANEFNVSEYDYDTFGYLYNALSKNSSPKEISLKLNSLGYTGIKVPAYNNSGNTSMQQPNYVIFNENDIIIKDKRMDIDTDDVEFDGKVGVVQNEKRKYGVINKNGELLSDWYDWIGQFYEDRAMVEIGDKCNFINQEGQLLSDQWFDNAFYYYNGFAKVGVKRKWNFINYEGCIISEQWFDGVNDFEEGFAIVRLKNKYNYLNKKGNLISDQWFDFAWDFNKMVMADVRLKHNMYLIDKNGTLYDYYTRQPIQLPNKGQDVVAECVRRVINEYVYRK